MFEIIIVLQQIVASTSHIVANDLTQDVPPALVLFYRMALASLMYAIIIFFRRKNQRRLDRSDYYVLPLLGFFNTINQFLFLTSIKMTAPPNVALAYAMTPAFVLIISALMSREKATTQKVTGIIVAFIGSFFLIFQDGFDLALDSTIGNILAFVASMSFGMYTVIGKRISTQYGAIYSTGLSMVASLVIYSIVFSFLDFDINVSSIPAINWMEICWLAFGTSGLGYFLWYYALKLRDASKVAVFNNLQPIFTTILSMIFLSHMPTPFFILGGIFIIGGVIITQKG